MDYVLTIVVAIVIFFLIYQITPKMPSHTHREPIKMNTYTLNPLNESAKEKTQEEIEKLEQIRKAKLRQDEFDEMMRYDVSTAYKRKGDIT
jgi:hypothetical protein